MLCGCKAAHSAQPGHLGHRGRAPAAAWQQPPHNTQSHIIYCTHSTSHPTAPQQAGPSAAGTSSAALAPQEAPPRQGTTSLRCARARQSRPHRLTHTGQVTRPRPLSQKLWQRYIAHTEQRSSWKQKSSFPTCQSTAFPKQHLFFKVPLQPGPTGVWRPLGPAGALCWVTKCHRLPAW